MNEEEKQELETLRAEKLRREQVERARAALERGGVPQSFAPLLAGGRRRRHGPPDGGIPRGVSGVSGGGREKPSARFRAGGDGSPAPASQTGHPAAEIGDGL